MCQNQYRVWLTLTVAGAIVTAPWSLVKDMKGFAIVNRIAVYSFVACLVSIVGYSAWYPNQTYVQGMTRSEERKMLGIGGLFKFIGLTTFSIENSSLVLPVRNSMVIPRNYIREAGIGAATLVVSAIIMGVVTYAKFGDNLMPMIFSNLFFEPSIIPKIAITIYVFVSYLNMPFTFYPTYQILSSYGWMPTIFDVRRLNYI